MLKGDIEGLKKTLLEYLSKDFNYYEISLKPKKTYRISVELF